MRREREEGGGRVLVNDNVQQEKCAKVLRQVTSTCNTHGLLIITPWASNNWLSVALLQHTRLYLQDQLELMCKCN